MKITLAESGFMFYRQILQPDFGLISLMNKHYIIKCVANTLFLSDFEKRVKNIANEQKTDTPLFLL